MAVLATTQSERSAEKPKVSSRNQLAGLLVRHTLFQRYPGEYAINFLINTKPVFARQAPLVLFI